MLYLSSKKVQFFQLSASAFLSLKPYSSPSFYLSCACVWRNSATICRASASFCWMEIQLNKLCLNGSKSEIIIFKSKQKTITKHFNFRVSDQKIHPTNTVKYLGVYLNDSLTWDTHLTVLLPKLNRAVGLLTKIRHYIHLNSY